MSLLLIHNVHPGKVFEFGYQVWKIVKQKKSTYSKHTVNVVSYAMSTMWWPAVLFVVESHDADDVNLSLFRSIGFRLACASPGQTSIAVFQDDLSDRAAPNEKEKEKEKENKRKKNRSQYYPFSKLDPWEHFALFRLFLFSFLHFFLFIYFSRVL